MSLNLSIPKVGTPFLDKLGNVNRDWYLFLSTFLQIVGGPTVNGSISPIVPIDISLTSNITGVLTVTSGGTALSTAPTGGQLLIGNGSTYTLASLTAGAGIGVLNGAGSITVSNTGILALTASTGIGVSGSTISNTGVLSVTGTANQIVASASVGAITLSTPQNTNTTATPTFSGLTINSLTLNGSAFAFTAASWTPTDNSGASLAFTGVACNYLKMGTMVFAYGTLNYPVTASGAAASIAGLPVAVPNQDYAQVPALVATSVSITGGLVMRAVKNTSTATFDVGSPFGAVTNLQLSGATLVFILIYPSG